MFCDDLYLLGLQYLVWDESTLLGVDEVDWNWMRAHEKAVRYG